jgi:hypothetical protein
MSHDQDLIDDLAHCIAQRPDWADLAGWYHDECRTAAASVLDRLAELGWRPPPTRPPGPPKCSVHSFPTMPNGAWSERCGNCGIDFDSAIDQMRGVIP